MTNPSQGTTEKMIECYATNVLKSSFGWISGRKTLCGDYATQIFVTDKWYVRFIQINFESSVAKGLRLFAEILGATEAIIYDSARS